MDGGMGDVECVNLLKVDGSTQRAGLLALHEH